MKTQVLVLAVSLLGLAGAASADQDDHHRDHGRIHEQLPHEQLPHERSPTLQAPELDPSSTITGLTLLAGVVVVLSGRRAIKSN
jgi:hypothetical protein